MTARLIDGKATAAAIRAKVAAGVAEFERRAGRPPGLATVLVGEDPASAVYVRSKNRATAEAGMAGFAHNLPDKDLHEALSYTWPYVTQIIKSRGKNLKIGADVLPAKGRPRIRDNNWWTDAERAGMKFASPPPWNKKA